MSNITFHEEQGGASKEPDAAPSENPSWLMALDDHVAQLDTLRSCVCVADIHGDNDWAVVAGCRDKKLKIWKKGTVMSQVTIPDEPTSICSFYYDHASCPAVAVAAGPYIYIYRNIRPYFKFRLPDIPVDPREKTIWEDLSDGKMGATNGFNELTQLRDEGVQVTSRTQKLISLESNESAREFIDQYLNGPMKPASYLTQYTVVTCLTKIKRDTHDLRALDLLVVGTESGHIHVLNADANAIASSYTLPSPPVFIETTGLWDHESRIVVACRNGRIYNIRNQKRVATTIEMESHIVDIALLPNQLIVACANEKLYGYHIKGRKLWSMSMGQRITALAPMSVEVVNTVSAVLVALNDGDIRTYNNQRLLATTGPAPTRKSPNTILFGRYGREDNCLLSFLGLDGIKVFILPRKATFLNRESSESAAGPPPEQDIPLAVPKKTRLYVTYSNREREEAVSIHQIFQRELCRTRLETARAYVGMVVSGQGPTSITSLSQIRLAVRIQGIGPKFHILIEITNSGKTCCENVLVSLACNQEKFRISTAHITFPLVIPHIALRHVVSLYDQSTNEQVEDSKSRQAHIVVHMPDTTMPIASAVIQIPPTAIV